MSGNPLAKLTWYVGVRQVASVYSTVDNYATAELALIPDQVKDFLKAQHFWHLYHTDVTAYTD